jgi:hypothetical protein
MGNLIVVDVSLIYSNLYSNNDPHHLRSLYWDLIHLRTFTTYIYNVMGFHGSQSTPSIQDSIERINESLGHIYMPEILHDHPHTALPTCCTLNSFVKWIARCRFHGLNWLRGRYPGYREPGHHEYPAQSEYPIMQRLFGTHLFSNGNRADSSINMDTFEAFLSHGLSSSYRDALGSISGPHAGEKRPRCEYPTFDTSTCPPPCSKRIALITPPSDPRPIESSKK